MVESLRELNKICQKQDYKTKGNWYVRTVLRDAALPATWLLLHTPVTANQITLISLAVSILAMFFLAIPGAGMFLAGVLLLQLWYYLDHVDGQIARYRKADSLTGRFLDFLTHHIVHVSLFFALGFYVYQILDSALFVVWGFVSALSILVFNVAHDVKYKTFFEALSKRGSVLMAKGTGSSGCAGPVPLKKRLFSFAHKLCEIHVMMNVLTFAAFIQAAGFSIDLRFLLFVLYGLLAPAIASLKLVYILTHKQIDQEYDKTFHASV